MKQKTQVMIAIKRSEKRIGRERGETYFIEMKDLEETFCNSQKS
jgi:hypothetical protein